MRRHMKRGSYNIAILVLDELYAGGFRGKTWGDFLSVLLLFL
jgi:hypothetical protein